MNIHCDPSKRHDFVFLFDVANGNPNGDPDAGNLPRVDAETNRGIVTDVCIKRKVRDYVQGVLGRPIFIQGDVALNSLYSKTLEGTKLCQPAKLSLADPNLDLKRFLDDADLEFGDWLASVEADGFDYDPDTMQVTYFPEAKGPKAIREQLIGETDAELKQKPELHQAVGTFIKKLAEACKEVKVSRPARAKAKEDMRDKYWDVRMFGAVLTGGTNAGQIRGPMQLTFATSIDAIVPRDISITRVAITRPSDMLRKQTEMGRKGYVPYGLYRLHGFYNPLLGVRANGTKGPSQVVSEQDLAEFWEALDKMFEFDRSAARGEMNSRGLYVFTHDNPKGNAPAHRLFDTVKVMGRGDSVARAFSDYAGQISVPPKGPLANFPGMHLTRLIHVQ
jgi:CRISPR-associated protein Csd2